MDLENFSNFIERRSWIDCRRDHFENLLDKKTEIITGTLLDSDEGDAVSSLILLLLRFCPVQESLSKFATKLLKSKCKEEQHKNINEFASYLGAVNALCYSLRLGRGRAKILPHVSPWLIPPGYIHILDLTPEELQKILIDAKETHGIETYKKAILEIFEMPLPQISENEIPNNNPAIKEIDKITKSVVKNTLQMVDASGEEKEKVNDSINEQKTGQILAAYQEKLFKIIPDYEIYESEFRKSISSLMPDEAKNFFEISLQYRKYRHGVRPSSCPKFFIRECKIHNKLITDKSKAVPHVVLRTYQGNLQKIKQYARMRNPSAAYMDYKSSSLNSPISMDAFISILSDIKDGEIHSLSARLLTAGELGIGVSACENHIKTAQRVQNINQKWADRISSMMYKK